MLTGEAGLGKSTALRALSELLVEWNVNSSVILTPTLTTSEFLEMVMLNFGFKEVPTSKAMRLKLLEDFLIRSDAAGRVSVLVVDEAHQLSEEAAPRKSVCWAIFRINWAASFAGRNG